MGKKMTKKKKQAQRRRRYLRAGIMGLLVAAGLGTMVGMAAFNSSVKPNRDMQWYVREGAVQVAAPAADEAYVQAADRTGDASTAALFAEPEGGSVLADYTEAPTETPTEAPAPEPTEAPNDDGTVSIKITAAGDCTFGGEEGAKGRRRFIDLLNKNGYSYFFNNVRSIFEDDDLTIINLEGPLTNAEKPAKHGLFIFKGDPEYVNILSCSSVELCNVANNHSLDYGKAGLKETAEVLTEKGIGFCGFSQAWNAEIKGVRVCSLGFTWWDYKAEDILKEVAEARGSCDLLIVNIHWGVEGATEQDAKQEKLGRAIVDAGADLVIGTHPHVYQGIEKYRGKYIIYSLGNFSFAGNANPADKRCLIFQQTFNFNPGMGIAQANITDAGVNVIPCTISSVADKNDLQPTVMPAKQGAALLKAVARHSTNFSLTDTLWMKDNYMVANGLIQSKAELEGPVAAEATSAEEAAEPPAEDESVT